MFISGMVNGADGGLNHTTVFVPVGESAGSRWFQGLLFALVASTNILPGLGAERETTGERFVVFVNQPDEHQVNSHSLTDTTES